MAKRIGGSTIVLEESVSVLASACVAAKQEALGPLAPYFDQLAPEASFGEQSWEKAESRMQKEALGKALAKAALPAEALDCVFAGDLLNQCIGSTFGLRELGVPYLGLYSACATMAEAITLGSLMLESGAAQRVAAVTSSHFCTAERQYRFPLEYGGQRPPTAQWTATAAGALVLTKAAAPPYIRALCPGRIVDWGIKDANNMGAAMAPAAATTLSAYFKDTGKTPADFDLVLTGDLGAVGSRILSELLEREGYPLGGRHNDCGLLLYDRERQDVHAGGSGAGCCASVMAGYILPAVKEGRIRELLFVATGALLSPTSTQQGESIPGIAHLVRISHA